MTTTNLGALGRVIAWKPQQAAIIFALMVVFVRWLRTLRERVRVSRNFALKHPVFDLFQKKSRALKEGYYPPALMSIGSKFVVGSISTVVHNVLRRTFKLPPPLYERELFKLECGATVGLDWVVRSGTGHTPHKDSSSPIIFMHHGLAGCSNSHYIHSIINMLLEKYQDIRICVMVARGCGGVPLTTPVGFTAAGYDDMRQVIDHLKEANPQAYMYGVGFSLAGGLMANYVGRSGVNCKLSGAVVVSPSWDFSKKTPIFPIWSRKFLCASLQEYFAQNREVLVQNEKIDYERCMACVTVREFDTHAVVPVFGYKDTDHYYDESSATYHAHEIHVPTLSLSADDDPVCAVDGAHDIEEDKRHGPGLVIARTSRGGHVSWPEGQIGYDSYMDRIIVDWIGACREHCESV